MWWLPLGAVVSIAACVGRPNKRPHCGVRGATKQAAKLFSLRAVADFGRFLGLM